MTYIQNKLFNLQDLTYKEFHSKLIPEINPETIVGVKIPLIRNMIKNLSLDEINEFLNSKLPHKYYEENNLHALLISNIKDYHSCIIELTRFLPYIDNWATCDSLRPVCFKNNKDKLINSINIWIRTNDIYTVRFAIEMLMVHFLDKDFKCEYLLKVSNVKSDNYYVKMMIAWYFSTALAKQYEHAVKFLENFSLSKWIHNKTIQKAIESLRLTNEQKLYLKSLKIT